MISIKKLFTAVVPLLCGTVWLLSVSFVAQAAPGQAADDEAGKIIDYLRTSVPEIGDMARNTQGGRLVMALDSVPDPAAKDRFERDFYRVYVGVNINDSGAGHRTRWGTFLVHKNCNEILWANYLRSGAYIPLADWRQFVNRAEIEKSNDLICIPFLRAGRIEPSSSIDDIIRLYGADKVEQRTIRGPEGIGSFDVSVIYPRTANEMLVYWENNDYGKRPARVSIRKTGSEWKTLYGIRIGTSLAELNRLNGRSFKFLGFNWDYGGSVDRDWEGGKLTALQDVSLVLGCSVQNLPSQYQGDRIISSDTEELLQQGLVWVRRIDVPLR
jgi:hypothetical protein